MFEFFGRLAERFKASVLKTEVGKTTGGSNPSPSSITPYRSLGSMPEEQRWVVTIRRPFNPPIGPYKEIECTTLGALGYNEEDAVANVTKDWGSREFTVVEVTPWPRR